MKSINKLTIFFLFFLTIIEPSLANDKTAFINIDYIIKNSNIGKRVLDKINKQNKINIDRLEKKNVSLKNLESEIKKKQNLISKEDFNNEVISFQDKVQAFTKEKNVIVKEFNELRNKEIKKIFTSINPIISKYMEDNSISILLDSKNIFMGDKNVNLTNDILKVINNIIK